MQRHIHSIKTRLNNVPISCFILHWHYYPVFVITHLNFPYHIFFFLFPTPDSTKHHSSPSSSLCWASIKESQADLNRWKHFRKAKGGSEGKLELCYIVWPSPFSVAAPMSKVNTIRVRSWFNDLTLLLYTVLQRLHTEGRYDVSYSVK